MQGAGHGSPQQVPACHKDNGISRIWPFSVRSLRRKDQVRQPDSGITSPGAKHRPSLMGTTTCRLQPESLGVDVLNSHSADEGYCRRVGAAFGAAEASRAMIPSRGFMRAPSRHHYVMRKVLALAALAASLWKARGGVWPGLNRRRLAAPPAPATRKSDQEPHDSELLTRR